MADGAAAAACCAALWLRCDYAEESHRISQEVETAEGSYWHAILHRREPDAANAKYWFRRVGDHPVFEALGRASQELGLERGAAAWNPLEFIDLCERHRGTHSAQEGVLLLVQQAEWTLLFDWCFSQAAGLPSMPRAPFQ